MFLFIAGAISFGDFDAMTIVERGSSAIPCAILPIMLAVQGAMMMRSAFSESEM